MTTAPPPGQASWDETLDHIAAQPAIWLRMAAVVNVTDLDSPTWEVRLLELTSGVQPPSWQLTSWLYPGCMFTGWVARGEQVAGWLREAHVVVVETRFQLPASMAQPIIRWDRHGTTVRPYFERVGWPTAEADLGGYWPNHQQEPQGPLVCDDFPSFASFYAAAAAFFWLDRQPVGGAVNPTIRYRHADCSARIAAVRIATDYVEVVVEGEHLDGVILELAGDAPGEQIKLESRHGGEALRFDLLGELPSGAWVLLKTGSSWLDRWYLNHSFRRATETAPEWVIEPRTRIEAALASRERHDVEFKSVVPRSVPGKRHMMATIASFANEDGGSLFVGINDDREVVGVDAASTGKTMDTIARLIRSWVHPRPAYTIDVLPYGADTEDETSEPLLVIEVNIPPGVAVYGVGTSADDAVVYVRPFTNIERASPAEIIQLSQRRANNAIPRLW